MAVVVFSRIMRSLVSPMPTYSRIPPVVLALPKVTAPAVVFPAVLSPTLDAPGLALLPKEVTVSVPPGTEVTPV